MGWVFSHPHPRRPQAVAARVARGAPAYPKKQPRHGHPHHPHRQCCFSGPRVGGLCVCVLGGGGSHRVEIQGKRNVRWSGVAGSPPQPPTPTRGAPGEASLRPGHDVAASAKPFRGRFCRPTAICIQLNVVKSKRFQSTSHRFVVNFSSTWFVMDGKFGGRVSHHPTIIETFWHDLFSIKVYKALDLLHGLEVLCRREVRLRELAIRFETTLQPCLQHTQVRSVKVGLQSLYCRAGSHCNSTPIDRIQLLFCQIFHGRVTDQVTAVINKLHGCCQPFSVVLEDSFGRTR